MMRVPFVLLLFLGVVASVAAQPPGMARNATDSDGQKQGLWSKTWPSTGNVRYQGQFKDDQPIGKFRYYDEEGILTSTMTFELGNPVSRSEHYHPNGSLMAQGNYRDKIKDGDWKYFDENGQIRKSESYLNGKLHGTITSYFPDGSVAERLHFNEGVQVDEWNQFYANGMKRMEGVMENGEPVGAMIWYYENGKPEIKGKYLNGEKHGAWVYYNDDGSIQLQILYDKGEYVRSKKENGVFKDYYDDDQLKSEVTWKNGLKNGPFKEFFNNGVWVEKETQDDPVKGIEGGDREKVLEGQTLKMSGTYKDDKLHGVVKTYNEKGKVVKEEKYVEGKKK